MIWLGVKVLPIEAISFRITGSLKSWSVPMIDRTTMNMTVRRTMGSFILAAIASSEAPSTLAASSTSCGTLVKLVSRIVML